MAGSADGVKESLIGVEVFGRRADYDPGAEPAVRIEAGRLRSRLADYYKELGERDPIHIHLPKGTYVPVFSRNGVAPPVEEMASEAEMAPDAARLDEVIVRRDDGHWLRWLIAAAVIIVAAIMAAYFVSRRPSARFSGKDSIVLA